MLMGVLRKIVNKQLIFKKNLIPLLWEKKNYQNFCSVKGLEPYVGPWALLKDMNWSQGKEVNSEKPPDQTPEKKVGVRSSDEYMLLELNKHGAKCITRLLRWLSEKVRW